MPKSPTAFRTISEVAEWLDTPAHVLRFWESKFTQVKPVKRAGGRRYYRLEDMALLGGIKKLLHGDGLTIKGVQKLLRERGVNHVAAQSAPVDGQVVVTEAPAPAPELVLSPEPPKPEPDPKPAPAPQRPVRKPATKKPAPDPLQGDLFAVTLQVPEHLRNDVADDGAAWTPGLLTAIGRTGSVTEQEKLAALADRLEALRAKLG